jgi:hypothetical protein
MKYIRLYESFRMINEQQGQIYKRPKDPYEYKVEDDNWLSRKKGTTKWYNITGGDFKPGYQKSIDMLDKEFPKARTEEAPKRGGEAAPKEAAPKEVEYTRDNGETAKGTIVDVDKEKETVTVKAPSGKEFEKPFDKVEMASDELKKLAETPPPAETKKEEKPATDQETQQRLLKSSMNNPPEGLKGFFLADQKAKDYISKKGSILSNEGETYCYPFPPDTKDNYVYISGDLKNPKDKTIYFGTKEEQQEVDGNDPDEIKDGIQIVNDMKKEIDDNTTSGKFFTKDEIEGKKKVFAPTKTGEVDEEARAKSKARDEAEDNMRSSKSGSKVTK